MENKTSGQVYEEYQKLRVVEDILRRNNRGLSLITPQISEIAFSIRLCKKVSGNLLTKTSEIVVESNMPFMGYRFEDISIDEFISEFRDYVKLPIFNRFIKLNRRQENQLSTWGLADFNKNVIYFEDIDISFGEECLKEQDKIQCFVDEFKKLIAGILATQHIPTESESKDFTRYFFLCERIDDLKRQAKEVSYGGYSYGRCESKKSLKMTLTYGEYNAKLLLVEKELKELNKQYEFLEVPRISYREKDKEDDEEEEFDDDEDDEEYED